MKKKKGKIGDDLRLPKGLKPRLKGVAEKHKRPMTRQVDVWVTADEEGVINL